MPPVILGSAEWSTKQRMLSLFWNAAQPSIRTTMTFNYPQLHRCGVYLLYIRMVMVIYAIISQQWRNQVWLQPLRIHMVPAVNCSWLNGFRVWWRHNKMRPASLPVTPLSPLSPGGCTHFHTYHVLCVSDGHTWGKRYVIANYRLKGRHFMKGKVRKKSSRSFTVGFLSINLSADYLGTEKLNVMQIHL